MRVLFQTEGTPRLGCGHIMRSHYLAQAARSRGLDVCFQARNQYTSDILTKLGETVIETFPDDFSSTVVVIDVPTATPASIVKSLRKHGAFVVLLDVLTDARVEADIVCDAMMTSRRAEKLLHSKKTRYLYGLQYACLDEQFRQHHSSIIPADRHQSKLLVAFGGSDILHCNAQFLSALNRQGFQGPAEIITGMGAGIADEILPIVAGWRDSQVMSEVRDMAIRMKEADLVVTKLGMTQLEAFCVGRDCVVVEPTQAHFDLQQALSDEYSDWPVCECGLVSDIAFENAAKETIFKLSNRNQRIEKGVCASQLVDGEGAERIIDALMQEINNRMMESEARE